MSDVSAAAPEQQDGGGEATIQEALQYAIYLHQERTYDAAETLYRRIIEAAPDFPDPHSFLGILLHQRGRSEQALVCLARAVELNPAFPGFYINYGNVLTGTGQVDEALAMYRRAFEFVPQSPDIYNNVGAIHHACGAHAEAEKVLLQAIALDPGHVRAYNNLGHVCVALGRVEEGVKHYGRAIELQPRQGDGRRYLGLAYYMQGKIKEAAEVFGEWMRADPDNPTARHMYAACSGVGVPDRADDDYIEQTFDGFANSFDQQLQVQLSYRAPEIVAEALARHLPQPTRQFDILDAGCGTGLCGPLIDAYAKSLVGVDLSGAMMAKAEGRGCYTKLEKAELTAFIEAANADYDVILSADTLVYFGPLERVSAAAEKALRPGGLLAFTVEFIASSADAPDFRINPHGRYAHNDVYVDRVLREAGFSVLEVRHEVLRMEVGKPVNGLLAIARKG